MKFIKIGLYIIGGFILLGVAAAGVFVATFDANDYKPEISEQVKQHTGRDFSLGDIKPAVFPWIGLELHQLSLNNAKGFKAEHMLKIETLDVRVAIMPLLTGKVQIDTLRLHGLQLALAKDKQGKTNWDDILQKQKASQQATDDKTAPVADLEEKLAEDKTSPLAALLVNGVEIKNASILWNDASTKQKVTLQNFNLQTGAIRLGQTLPIELSTTIGLSEPRATFDIKLLSQVDFDPQTQALKLDALALSVDGALKELGIKHAQINLNSKLDANLKQQVFNLPEITLNINVSGDAIPGGKLATLIKSEANINLEKQTANIKQLNIETLGLNMQSQIAVTKLLSSPVAKGDFKLSTFDPKKLLKQLAIELPEMQGKQALKKSSVSFTFVGNEKTVNLSDLLVKLDQSKITGAASVTQFNKPTIKYQFSLDKINLDHYLPPPVAATKGEEDKSAKKANVTGPVIADTPIELPVKMLRDLNVSGSFKAQSIQVAEQTVSNLMVETNARGGLIKVPVVKAKLLDGGVSASIQLDVRKNTPRYQMSLNGKGLEADSVATPVLRDISGEKDVRLTGASDLVLAINSKGQSVKQLMTNSNGQFKFNMGKAELHDVDIEFYARKAVTEYMDEKKVPVKDRWRGEYKPKQTTALRVVRATATIKNGLFENNDLLLESPRFKVTGKGKINLPKESINYQTVIDINPHSVKTTADKVLDVPLPVKVKGSFSNPVIDIQRTVWLKSIGKVLKSETKKAVKKKATKKLDKKLDELKDKYKDKFKLFR